MPGSFNHFLSSPADEIDETDSASDEGEGELLTVQRGGVKYVVDLASCDVFGPSSSQGAAEAGDLVRAAMPMPRGP